ncbi:MAG: hypothetical protein N2C13_03995 [Chloroflexota bacterium]
MKTLCLHHNDADGRASGAIVRRALQPNLELFEMDYGDPIPWEKIDTVEQVVVVDFSLASSDMLTVAEKCELVWIDHHKSSIEEMEDIAVNWPGVRSLEEAACVLTWQYYFPDVAVPKAVILIGDRDIWRWAEEDTGAFCEGLFNQDSRVDNLALWKSLLDNDPSMLNQLIESGSILRAAQLTSIQRKVKAYGQEVEFEGHRTLMVNERGTGEMGEYIGKLGYEIGYCYIDMPQEGKLMTKVTLYSKVVDVSVIASKFGGGGHAGAAGFTFERDKLPLPVQS